jgi:hypothetical protein
MKERALGSRFFDPGSPGFAAHRAEARDAPMSAALVCQNHGDRSAVPLIVQSDNLLAFGDRYMSDSSLQFLTTEYLVSAAFVFVMSRFSYAQKVARARLVTPMACANLGSGSIKRRV